MENAALIKFLLEREKIFVLKRNRLTRFGAKMNAPGCWGSACPYHV